MNKSVKYILSSLLAVIIIILPISGVYAEEQNNVAIINGIKANLILDEQEDGQILATVKVSNMNCPNLGRVECDITVPDGYIKTADHTSADVISNGSSEKFVFTIEKCEEKPNYLIYIIIGIAAVLAAVAVLLIVKGRKRNTVALLIAFALLLPVVSLNVSHAEAGTYMRHISLSNTTKTLENNINISAKIDYEYIFTEENAVKTTGFKQFDISYFYGPPGFYNLEITDDIVKDIVDCGFTTVPLTIGAKKAQAALDLFEKYGLRCSSFYFANITDHIIVLGNPDEITQEHVNEVVRKETAPYLDRDIIDGWNGIDEPQGSRFPILEKVSRAFREFAPGKEIHYNLFPNYASNELLEAKSYSQYVNDFIEAANPDYLSFDYYHFTSPTTSSDLGKLFDNLEYIRKTGQKYGIDQMQILLITQHGGYGYLTPYQLQWEVNVALAYGMKRVSYFTYLNDPAMERDGWYGACITSTGEKTEHYYDVQRVNKWLMPLGTELFGKTSTAVFHMRDEDENLGLYAADYLSYGALGTANGRNFLIGFFEDESFMVVNKDYYEKEEGLKNTFEFYDVTEGLECFNTTSASWQDAEADSVAIRNDEGRLAVSFEPGQGYLFRVTH